MPSRRPSLKSVAVEIVLFIGLFALVGHLTLNFWERYNIQSELSNMKTSLHSLKDTITGVGNAYDNLHNELKVIVAKAEMKPVAISVNQRDLHCCTHKYTLDRSPKQDHEVQTIAKLNKTNNFKWSESAGKNATTITKYPPTSSAVGSDVLNNQEQYNLVTSRYKVQSNDYGHKCNKDYENCKHSYTSWNHFGVY